MVDAKAERNRTVEQNVGLVHACANRFRDRGVEYDDLFQAGCVGLIKAADNFDESKGYSFSTYAFYLIMGEIRRIFRDGGSVKVGRTTKERSRLLMKEKERLTAALDREPTVGELAEAMGTDVAAVAELLNVAQPVLSLTVGEDGENEWDVPTVSPEEGIADRLALQQVLSALPERDRRMIELRFFEGKTQAVTAQRLGMSQVQVSRRERVVLSELRQKLLR